MMSEITAVSPREETKTRIIEHVLENHSKIKQNEINITDSILQHGVSNERLEATFECQECSYSVNEVYTLRYIENNETGDRKSITGITTCTCEEAKNNEPVFAEIERRKQSDSIAVAVSECEYCGVEWHDVYKYELLEEH